MSLEGLPKSIVKRFKEQAEYTERLEMTYKEATAVVKYSQGSYIIKVTKPFCNPVLAQGNLDEVVSYWRPTSKGNWVKIEIPEELMFVVDSLRVMCDVTVEERFSQINVAKEAVSSYYSQMR